jgi:hypothetical protein
MADQKISIVIAARNKVAAGFRGVVSAAKKLRAKVGAYLAGVANIAKRVAASIGIIGAAAVAVGKRMVSQYQVQAAAEAKLSATLKATGYAAGFTTVQLKEQAAQLQKTTGVGDETILSMQGILATFKNIRGDVFTQATSAILDMGAAMGKAGKGSADVEAAVIQVGKALNDPIRGMAALNRVGIQFTEQQREQITALQESGDIQAAQAIILKELETQFSGTAKAVADSAGGMMQLKAVIGDAQEEIGRVIVESNGFKGVIEKVTKAVEDLIESGTIDLWAQNVRSAIASLVPVMKKMGTGWTWIKDKVAGAAAFWGAIAGGAGIDEAVKAMDIIPKKVEAEKQARLQAIREEKKARAEATEEAEKAEMAAATVKRDADEAANKKIAAEKKLAEEEKKLRKELAAKKIAAEKKLAEEEKKLRKELAAEEKRLALQTANEKKRLLDEQLAKAKEVAEKTISGFIEERRAAKKAKEDDAAEFRKAAKLAEKERRGIRLSKRDKEFLDVAREIDKERRKLPGLNVEAAKAQKQIDALAENTKTLGEIKKLLDDNLKEQQALSKLG